VNLGVTVEALGSLGSEESKTVKSHVTRLVIVGDSDFAANAYLDVVGNRDLFLNAVSWLAEEEDLIAIRPIPSDQHQIYVTASQARWVLYASTLFLPLAVLTVGGVVWLRRR
jgi:ABC-type uncharacterized transport system involved in gliding motility auxiliary subunit